MALGKSLGEALREANGDFKTNENHSHGIRSGCRDLDQQLEGLKFLKPGSLCEISGPSGSGKTSLAIQFVKNCNSRTLWIDTVGIVSKERFNNNNNSGCCCRTVDHVQISSLSQLVAFVKYGLDNLSSDVEMIVIDNLTSATKLEPVRESQPPYLRSSRRDDINVQPQSSSLRSSSLSSSLYYTLSSPSTPRSKRKPNHVYESHKLKMDRAISELLVCLSRLANKHGLCVLILTQMATSFISTPNGLKPVLASSIRRQTVRQAGESTKRTNNNTGSGILSAINPTKHLGHLILIYPCRAAEKLAGPSARLCQLISYKQHHLRALTTTSLLEHNPTTCYCFLRLSRNGIISDISHDDDDETLYNNIKSTPKCIQDNNNLNSSLRDYDYYEEAYGLEGDPDTSY